MSETNGYAPIPAEVATAICDVMAGVRMLAKDDTNPHQRYDFVSTDKFLAAVNPLCVKAGLVILQDEASTEIVPGAEGKAGWLFARYSFLLAHRSGQTWGPLYRTVMVPANGAQAYGSAQSYALKQLMRSVFQIPTGDKDDADLQDKEALPQQPRQAKRPAPQREPEPEPAQEPYASSEQIDLLCALVKSSAFSEREREGVLQLVAEGLTRSHASHLIDDAQEVLRRRKKRDTSQPDEAA